MNMDQGKRMESCAFDTLFTKSVPHILEKIFFSLNYESYKRCFHVSNAWKGLLTSESFERKRKSVFHDDILREELELFEASYEGSTEEVRRLLSSGLVDVNCVRGKGSDFFLNPLSEAAVAGHKEVVKILLDRGAKIDQQDEHGCTPLYLAAQFNKQDMVQLLLKRGAQPNVADNSGNTPLHEASQNGNKDIVQLLLEAGAMPDQANKDEDIPLNWAVRWNHIDGDNMDVIKILLERGPDPNALGFSEGFFSSYE